MKGPYRVNSNARRLAAWGPPCSKQATAGRVTIEGRSYPVNPMAQEAFQVWELVRAKHKYTMPGTDTGFYNCRHMRFDPKLPYSTHSWAMALDANWLQNPAGSRLVNDFPKAMVAELLSVKTSSGEYVFTWLGDPDRNPNTAHSYYDAMHWEVTAHPLDLATGIVYTGRHELVDSLDMSNAEGLKPGMRGNAVRALQLHLNAWKPELALIVDGIYGKEGATQAAVGLYQGSATPLETTGIADPTTLAFLLTAPLRDASVLERLRGAK